MRTVNTLDFSDNFVILFVSQSNIDFFWISIPSSLCQVSCITVYALLNETMNRELDRWLRLRALLLFQRTGVQFPAPDMGANNHL